jgi:hypothetical protein
MLSDHEDCLKLSKAMQKTSEMLQKTADLYDDHVSPESHIVLVQPSIDRLHKGKANSACNARVTEKCSTSLYAV